MLLTNCSHVTPPRLVPPRAPFAARQVPSPGLAPEGAEPAVRRVVRTTPTTEAPTRERGDESVRVVLVGRQDSGAPRLGDIVRSVVFGALEAASNEQHLHTEGHRITSAVASTSVTSSVQYTRKARGAVGS